MHREDFRIPAFAGLTSTYLLSKRVALLEGRGRDGQALALG